MVESWGIATLRAHSEMTSPLWRIDVSNNIVENPQALQESAYVTIC